MRSAIVFADKSGCCSSIIQFLKSQCFYFFRSPNRTYMADSHAQIQPLVEKVQAEATKLQEKVKPFITNIEDQMRPITDNFKAQVLPLTDNFHTQVKPVADMFEKFFMQVLDQTKALLPPQ